MSRIADTLIGIEDAFRIAKDEYDFWTGELEQNGYDVDNAIAAAQYYGQMVGIAAVEKEIYDPDISPLSEIIRTMEKPKLYREDYE